MKTWGFKKEGCVNKERTEVTLCTDCKLNPWQCAIFKEDSDFEYIYTAAGTY